MQELWSATWESFPNPWWPLNSTAIGLKLPGAYRLLTTVALVLSSQAVFELDQNVHICLIKLKPTDCHSSEKDLTEKLEQFRVLLKKLPPENYNNLRSEASHWKENGQLWHCLHLLGSSFRQPFQICSVTSPRFESVWVDWVEHLFASSMHRCALILWSSCRPVTVSTSAQWQQQYPDKYCEIYRTVTVRPSQLELSTSAKYKHTDQEQHFDTFEILFFVSFPN